MKYAGDYVDDAIGKLMDDCGSFFAFGNAQFNDKKVDGVEYVNMPISGMICQKRTPESCGPRCS